MVNFTHLYLGVFSLFTSLFSFLNIIYCYYFKLYLNITTNIRQLPETSVLFMDGIATDLNKGYFEQNVKLWDLNENLVATSSQVAKILKSNERLGIAKE